MYLYKYTLCTISAGTRKRGEGFARRTPMNTIDHLLFADPQFWETAEYLQLDPNSRKGLVSGTQQDLVESAVLLV